MEAGQQRDRRAFGALVMLERDRPVDMHRLIIPRRNMAVVVLLAGVGIGRDVAVLALENRHHLRAVRHVPVQVIGQRDMADQIAIRRGQQRQMVRHHPQIRHHDHAGQRRARHHIGNHGGVNLKKLGGGIHRHSPNTPYSCRIGAQMTIRPRYRLPRNPDLRYPHPQTT